MGVASSPSGCLTAAPGDCSIDRSSSITDAPRPLNNSELRLWRECRKLPDRVRDYLVKLFLRYRWRHPLEFNVPRLFSSMRLPPSHPNAFHPALVNAILLNGCLYAAEAFQELELLIANQLRKDLQHSLADADRRFDCIRASAFFGCYLYSKWRTVEGRHYISGSLSLAIACGLHRIESLSPDTQAATAVITPAKDLIELGDLVNTFWTAFVIDRIAPLFDGGVALAPSDQSICTVWPCPWEYYENGRAFLRRYETLKSLLDSDSHSAWDFNDNPVALRAKGYVLLARASTLHARCEARCWLNAEFWDEVRLTSHSISGFADFISTFPYPFEDSIDVEGTTSIMATASLAAHVAAIQIYDILGLIQPGGDALDRQRIACRRAISVVQEVAQLGDEYFPLAIGMILAPVYEFLLGEVRRQVNEQTIIADINLVMDTRKRLKQYMPPECEPDLDRMWSYPTLP
ncbi:hypothetical protein BOTBODRAFT_180851 [Botryobasidium botryosum FD-172 SS1]|uniref:Transcription factor domain-containing protein n=1 Tax=Botryobasidium botryosum (strain FD-172 SS1) TaxID=930990 RepID=A0A067M5W4_BOTB1|nr:hypothetical protein BOTBODRAFT_180851 [Botryobasidium botryosum FD-172 SS1]